MANKLCKKRGSLIYSEGQYIAYPKRHEFGTSVLDTVGKIEQSWHRKKKIVDLRRTWLRKDKGLLNPANLDRYAKIYDVDDVNFVSNYYLGRRTSETNSL